MIFTVRRLSGRNLNGNGEESPADPIHRGPMIADQTFRTDERMRLAEVLSFSPAHARVEHRPLASINRARMRIYRALSDFRHQRTGLPKS